MLLSVRLDKLQDPSLDFTGAVCCCFYVVSSYRIDAVFFCETRIVVVVLVDDGAGCCWLQLQ